LSAGRVVFKAVEAAAADAAAAPTPPAGRANSSPVGMGLAGSVSVAPPLNASHPRGIVRKVVDRDREDRERIRRKQRERVVRTRERTKDGDNTYVPLNDKP
jgi:hypothetical protein